MNSAAATCLMAIGLFASATAAAECGRLDVPVAVVVNAKENGKRVYSVPITVGSTHLRAVLDTGSVPLLVLPQQLRAKDAAATGDTFSYTYGGDRYYEGDVEQGTARIGGAEGAIKLGAVTQAGCLPDSPNCVIAGEPPAKADFGGEYPAIVGARLDSGKLLSNALVQLGARRYILSAPRLDPGEDVGHLILEPSANETSGYRPLRSVSVIDRATGTAFADTVSGCLRDLTRGIDICGAVFFDSGRTGIFVYQQGNKPEVRAFGKGDRGQIEFTDGSGGQIAGVDFPIDFNPVLTVSFAKTYGRYASAGTGEALPLILVGQAPYLGLNVLTDFDRPGFAVAVRPPQRDGLVGHVP